MKNKHRACNLCQKALDENSAIFLRDSTYNNKKLNLIIGKEKVSSFEEIFFQITKQLESFEYLDTLNNINFSCPLDVKAIKIIPNSISNWCTHSDIYKLQKASENGYTLWMPFINECESSVYKGTVTMHFISKNKKNVSSLYKQLYFSTELEPQPEYEEIIINEFWNEVLNSSAVSKKLDQICVKISSSFDEYFISQKLTLVKFNFLSSYESVLPCTILGISFPKKERTDQEEIGKDFNLEKILKKFDPCIFLD